MNELRSFADELGLEKPDLDPSDAESLGVIGDPELDAILRLGEPPAVDPPAVVKAPPLDRGRRQSQASVEVAADGRRRADKRRIDRSRVGPAAAERPPQSRASIIRLLVAAIITVLVLSWIATSCLGDDTEAIDATGETLIAGSSTSSTTSTTAASTTLPATPDLAAQAADALAAANIVGISASVDGSTVTLVGVVDDAEISAAAEAAVLALDGVEAVDNKIVVQAARDLTAEANQALVDAGFAGVTAAVSGDVATLTGEAASGEQRLAAEVAVLSISGIESVDNQISVPPTAAEIFAAKLNDLVTEKPIIFSAGSADIANSSKATLDSAAQIIIDNPTGLVEIGGHTDSDGGAEANKALSQERAQAVLDYLVSKVSIRLALVQSATAKTHHLCPTVLGRIKGRTAESNSRSLNQERNSISGPVALPG